MVQINPPIQAIGPPLPPTGGSANLPSALASSQMLASQQGNVAMAQVMDRASKREFQLAEMQFDFDREFKDRKDFMQREMNYLTTAPGIMQAQGQRAESFAAAGETMEKTRMMAPTFNMAQRMFEDALKGTDQARKMAELNMAMEVMSWLYNFYAMQQMQEDQRKKSPQDQYIQDVNAAGAGPAGGQPGQPQSLLPPQQNLPEAVRNAKKGLYDSGQQMQKLLDGWKGWGEAIVTNMENSYKPNGDGGAVASAARDMRRGLPLTVDEFNEKMEAGEIQPQSIARTFMGANIVQNELNEYFGPAYDESDNITRAGAVREMAMNPDEYLIGKPKQKIDYLSPVGYENWPKMLPEFKTYDEYANWLNSGGDPSKAMPSDKAMALAKQLLEQGQTEIEPERQLVKPPGVIGSLALVSRDFALKQPPALAAKAVAKGAKSYGKALAEQVNMRTIEELARKLVKEAQDKLPAAQEMKNAMALTAHITLTDPNTLTGDENTNNKLYVARSLIWGIHPDIIMGRLEKEFPNDPVRFDAELKGLIADLLRRSELPSAQRMLALSGRNDLTSPFMAMIINDVRMRMGLPQKVFVNPDTGESTGLYRGGLRERSNNAGDILAPGNMR